MRDRMDDRNYNDSDNRRYRRFGGRFPWPLVVLGGLVVVPGLLFLGSWIIMLLWNALLPGIFGLGVISLWQAMGLAVLARLLFHGHGGMHHRPMGPGGIPRRPRFRDREEWRDHLRDRFAEEDQRYRRHPRHPHDRFRWDAEGRRDGESAEGADAEDGED